MFEFLKVGHHFRSAREIVASMSQDDERVYRNQIAYLSEVREEVELSAIGLFRARLFGAAFPLFAFSSRWPSREKERAELLTFAIMQCGAGLPVASGRNSLPRDFVRSVFAPSLGKQTQLIQGELAEGPSQHESLTSGFRGLLEICHDNLAETFPDAYYSDDRKRVNEMLVSGLFTRFDLLIQMHDEMEK